MGKVFMIADGLENMGPLRTGGQGSVYKGRRTGAILSAVKLLPTPICDENVDDKNFRDFQNEVIKLKKVNEHPNPHVVKILNSGLTDSGGFPFIEMEYIEGHDLEDLIKSPHDPVFTIKEVINVAHQLSSALAHCHRAGIMHGDIKSNNVKFNTHSGNYVLLDFGLAVMSDEQRRTSLRYAGAIEFMAPEQNEGIMLFESDIYSFGIILYELLTGRVPFPLSGNSETARNMVMVSHLEAPVPDVRANRRENLPDHWTDEKKEQEMQIPGWLLNVVSRCLNKKPEDRYENGIELYEYIMASQTSIGILTTSEKSNSALLQKENERLHLLLSKQKQTLSDKELQLASVRQMVSAVDSELTALKSGSTNYIPYKNIRIPKAAFIALLVLLLSFSAFAGYSILSGNKVTRAATIEEHNIPSPVKKSNEPATALSDRASDAVTEDLQSEQEQPDREDFTPTRVANVSTISDAANTDRPKSRRELRKKEREREKSQKKKGKFIEIKFVKP